MKDFPKLISNSLLSVAFAAVFIGIFFFTYAKNIEKQVVLNNLNYTISGLFDSFLPYVKAFGLSSYINFDSLDESHNNDDSEAKADKAVLNNNNILLEKATSVLLLLLLSVFIIVFIISKKYDLNFKDLIFENLILVTGIGIVEYIFLNFVGAQFISADNNAVIKQILTSIDSKI